MVEDIKRCEWAKAGSYCLDYHDREWGVPIHEDRVHFEFLVLDGFQAGLSWEIILRKRENLRRAFSDFDAEEVAKYGEKHIQDLLKDSGIIRNRLKIQAAVNNARAFLKVQKEHGSFDAYIWRFVGARTRHNSWRSLKDIPAKTEESGQMSKDLRKRGFSFVGPTICYAYMQAAGLVNDHTTECFRYAELKALKS
jgi:DNA-3-methyladenine glycosylase I